jgi:hypothetical protein
MVSQVGAVNAWCARFGEKRTDGERVPYPRASWTADAKHRRAPGGSARIDAGAAVAGSRVDALQGRG